VLRAATDYHRLALEVGVENLFHCNEEGVKVDMHDCSCSHVVTPYPGDGFILTQAVTRAGVVLFIMTDCI